MDTSGEKALMATDQASSRSAAESFGIYRAEWLQGALYNLFTKPNYYPELETHRPCILMGGRGTGKTTVLRCLSYDGKFRLEGEDGTAVTQWPYYGFYDRVNTNRVTAFRGEELSEDSWTRIFAHYVNLSMCGQVLSFLEWFKEHVPGAEPLGNATCEDIAESLHIETATSQEQLRLSISRGKRRFEAFLNNLDSDSIPPLSLQGQPVDDLCEALLKLPDFLGKHLFFIVDEFENFLPYQQRVLNTIIKHCGAFYTFKVGVKELGWSRDTLNENERLQSPADYELIDIGQRLQGENFARFAEDVCRLRANSAEDLPAGVDILDLFPALTVDEEANLLGVAPHSRQVRERCRGDVARELAGMSDFEVYFADYWAKGQKTRLELVLTERREHPSSWADRLNNYSVAALFSIRAGRAGIRKYYAGWRTYLKMADGNVRYILQLVGQALSLHGRDGLTLDTPVTAEVQTVAAQEIGRRNLSDLEGLSVHGARVTKLLLSLGRVFEVLARDNLGHAPEVTQFYFPDDVALGKSEALVRAAVMHLALVRMVSTKRGDEDLKSYDYAIHPIFAAFFVFSHRKKRKIRITPTQLLGLVEEPKTFIRQILRQHGRMHMYPLPEQMQLFEGFYGELT
jgi:hypothetical protein